MSDSVNAHRERALKIAELMFMAGTEHKGGTLPPALKATIVQSMLGSFRAGFRAGWGMCAVDPCPQDPAAPPSP